MWDLLKAPTSAIHAAKRCVSCTTLGGFFPPPLLIARASFGGGVVSLPQKQQHAAAAAAAATASRFTRTSSTQLCCLPSCGSLVVVVVAVPLAYVLVFYFLARTPPLPKLSAQLFFLYGDMCPRFRGCRMLLRIERSVSARYQKTRLLLRARLLLIDAAASGSVRHKFQNDMQ